MTERKAYFIHELAKFLAGNQAGKNIALELEMKQYKPIISWAQEWAAMRAASPLFGYPSVEEAEAQLKEFLK